jgi:predicted tellurium resistance membrane protein TerC
LFKSTSEIYQNLEGEEEGQTPGGKTYGFAGIIVQIASIDIIFSLDAVITAVELVDNVPVMVAAIIISVV